ncbi:MAG: nucleoside 2-deoxyribosyltransferase [Ferrovibrio sp.]|uniref:nucleoside 2-deoxyribosyltransferase n=1 Tax=Ferrovibrio sp. TaxID=1917215 RepID=UPI00260784F9|nr:nucleoside 2-deoxyribosyltransferase [Ferrovibrio sp.]MCW0233003.1 nucleoside 2-deoxyribosyltransferase [Ferrovibrio sp.]
MALKLYLAGPDVFAPDAAMRFDAMRAACRAAGFEPLTPVDNALPADLEGAALADVIKQVNVGLIRCCDAVVANISPFRGPNMDPGTAWEIGFAEALGKPVFLWSETAALLAVRTPGDGNADPDGWMVENFGLAENLMIAVNPHSVATDFAAVLGRVAATWSGN